MPFSLDQFSLNLVGLSTIFSQRPQQIGENLLCESEFCACSGFRRSSRDSSAAALHIGHMLSRVALTGTIVRLGEALPVVFFSSAVDFILPVNCRRSTTAVRAASGTAGKMNSSEAEPRHAAPPARAACEGRLWPQQVDQTGVKACRRRAVVARAETAAEEPSAVASQRLPGSQSGSTCPF